jgi:hypothetical protein
MVIKAEALGDHPQESSRQILHRHCIFGKTLPALQQIKTSAIRIMKYIIAIDVFQ